MRHDNGRLEPVGKKVKKYNLPTGSWSKIWVHDQDELENYIGLDSSNNLKIITPGDGSSSLIKAYSSTVSVEFIKRFMVVLYATGMDVFIWKDDAYSLVSIPNRPVLTFEETDTTNYTADSGGNANEILAQYFEKINEASNLNHHTGGIMLRAAVKMYDGNYILHSIPEYINLGLEMTLGPGLPGVHFKASKINVSIEPSLFSEINTDIYTHIVIFACKNEELYQMDEKGLTDDMLAAAGAVYPIQFEDLFTEINPDFKKLADSSAWYKVHEFVISEIQEESSTVTETIEMDGFYQDYATRETLPVDQFSHHSLFGSISFNYNSRLILGDITTKLGNYTYYPLLPSEANDRSAIPSGFTYAEDLAVKLLVTLNTDWGEVKKLIDVGNRPFFTKDGYDPTFKIFTLGQSVTGYPDARAIKIEILVQKSGLWYNVNSVSLTKATFGNYAYFHSSLFTLDATPADSYIILLGAYVASAYNYGMITIGSNFPSAKQISDPDTLYPENSYKDSNRVQASEVSNPMFFPAENSYQVGTGKIIGIASNSEPLSTGQFGEYPLQVFTAKGIWAMLQGTGDVLFSNVVPSGSEVANEGTITSVGGGVVFATATGLYLLVGRDPTELTHEVKGSPNTDFQSNTNYQFYLDDSRLLTGMDTKLSNVDILSYISGAKIGFDKVNEELLVTNNTKNYSYVYSFKTGFWHKSDESFNILINYYPKLYVLRESGSDTGIISISDEVYTDTVKVLLTTQPLKFNLGDNFKVIRRIALRCMVTPETGTHAGFYVFASSDLITWQRVKGINHLTGTKRDFLLTRTGGKAKYHIIVFAGQISCSSYIDSLDTLIDLKLNNKLR